MRLPWTFIADVDTPSAAEHDGGGVCYRLNVSIVRIKFVRLGTVCSTCGGKLEVRQPGLNPSRWKIECEEDEIVCEHGCNSRSHQVRASRLLLVVGS
jgi:hypothetical protein